MKKAIAYAVRRRTTMEYVNFSYDINGIFKSKGAAQAAINRRATNPEAFEVVVLVPEFEAEVE